MLARGRETGRSRERTKSLEHKEHNVTDDGAHEDETQTLPRPIPTGHIQNYATRTTCSVRHTEPTNVNHVNARAEQDWGLVVQSFAQVAGRDRDDM